MNAQEIIKRMSLTEERYNWDSYWDEIYKYVIHGSGR